MTASDWCLHSAVGRVHSLRSCRLWLEVPAWVAWLTAATQTMLELWRQLMTEPLLPSRCRDQLFASEQVAEVTWITQRSNCEQLG